KLALILLFQRLAQVFRRNETRFAVAEVAAGLRAEIDEGCVCQANDQCVSIHEKLRVDGVSMTRRDAIAHARETALLNLSAGLGGYFVGANNPADGVVVG